MFVVKAYLPVNESFGKKKKKKKNESFGLNLYFIFV
jgi:hypothetical protein